MRRLREKRQADQQSRAIKRLAAIEAEVACLQDEDLLDLADIFRERADGPLARAAQAEMNRRGISL